MCGIIGILLLNQERELHPEEVERGLQVLEHRGPDGSAIWQQGQLILGHRRLAIIDPTSRSDQPMVLRCAKTRTTFTIVFNGEIYNYQEIKKELTHLGHSFSTGSDTEVILHSWEEWGTACFKKFRGMFALAIWDEEKQILILARDPFGIKPLYYYRDNQRFIFASELKGVISFTGVSQSVNPASSYLFLRGGSIPSPSTWYEHISSLEPGSYLLVSRAKFEKKRYEDIASFFSEEVQEMSYSEAIRQTRAQLRDTVEAHLVSDVEVGAFLSGGVDSSALVALMRELGQERITTVSATFPGTVYDEQAKVEKIVSRFQTNHLNLSLSGTDFLNQLESIFEAMDQPTVDGVNTYFVSMVARQAGLKVVLSGLGGDEVFFGYPSFTDLPRLLRFRPFLQYFLAQGFLALSQKEDFGGSRFGRLAELLQPRGHEPPLVSFYKAYRGLFSGREINRLLKSHLVHQHNLHFLNEELFEKIQGAEARVSYLEFSNYLQNQLLRDTDVMSMKHSLEARVPFVDRKLLQAVNRIPYRHRTGKRKALLKAAVSDLLPSGILEQKKQGFVLPLELWLRGEARELVNHELLNSKIFNLETVKLILGKFEARRLHWSRVWILFVLNRFLKNLN